MRSKGKHLTGADIKTIRAAFDAGRTTGDIAGEMQFDRRTASRYYAMFRGKPQKLGRPKYRELIHTPRQLSAAPQSRFYKSNFEI